ncbi:hypothetical protein [Rhodopirellula bahusiensis]|uniref:hypothetical protein n=1 Tax=Rhodopirellula bahusiensis TaxID=2014065 RepID=UPI003263C64F
MISKAIQRRIAHLDVLAEMQFPVSISHWHSGGPQEFRWTRRKSQADPILIGRRDALEIDADADSTISAPDGGIVHINGDVNADLELGEHHEVIICGDVCKNATIRADGYHHLYVAGSVFGEIAVSGSSSIWIDGDFKGKLTTGTPSAQVRVLGDFAGEVNPLEQAALLSLAVGGYASHGLMTDLAMKGYVEFHATVGRSNVVPGLYPIGTGHRKNEHGNSFSRWCVHAQADPSQPPADLPAW